MGKKLLMIVAGFLVLIFVVGGAWSLSNWLSVRRYLDIEPCNGQIAWLAFECSQYAKRHDGRYPSRLDDLFSGVAATQLCCPTGLKRKVAGPGYAIEGNLGDYIWGEWPYPGYPIMLYDATLDNHGGKGRNVAYLDCRIEWWPAAREGEFQQLLTRQRQWIGEHCTGGDVKPASEPKKDDAK